MSKHDVIRCRCAVEVMSEPALLTSSGAMGPDRTGSRRSDFSHRLGELPGIEVGEVGRGHR